ncbi:MAG: hypothetical protein IJY87_04300 [Bacilli bacterium]|nr:hypothetical protein [Bacilli bacterium]
MRTYIEVGELLNSIDTKYGKNVIKDYADKLTNKFGRNIQFLFYIK